MSKKTQLISKSFLSFWALITAVVFALQPISGSSSDPSHGLLATSVYCYTGYLVILAAAIWLPLQKKGFKLITNIVLAVGIIWWFAMILTGSSLSPMIMNFWSFFKEFLASVSVLAPFVFINFFADSSITSLFHLAFKALRALFSVEVLIVTFFLGLNLAFTFGNTANTNHLNEYLGCLTIVILLIIAAFSLSSFFKGKVLVTLTILMLIANFPLFFNSDLWLVFVINLLTIVSLWGLTFYSYKKNK